MSEEEKVVLTANNMAIRIVYLHSTKTTLFNDFDPLTPGQELVPQFRMTLNESKFRVLVDESGSTKHLLKYQIGAGLRYLKKPFPEEALQDEKMLSEFFAAELTAVFVAEYAVDPDAGTPSKDTIKSFGENNSSMHIWPYWREYCQSTCSRMALPVSVVPLLGYSQET